MKQRTQLVIVNMSTRAEWSSGIANRNYHVMRSLLASGRFEKVLSVDFIPFSRKRRVKQRFTKRGGPGTQVFDSGGVRAVQDPDNNALVWVQAASVDALSQALPHLGVDEERAVLWSYDPFAAPLFERWPNALRVFDAVDNWAEHPAYAAYTDELREHYGTVRKHADVIFTVSEALIALFEKRERAVYIPNGVDATHFGSGSCRIKEYAPEVREGAQIIGYHGVIQSRVNPRVFQYLAERFPEREVVVVGSIWKEVRAAFDALRSVSNIHLVDAVPYNALPELISCFDVAVIPHRVDSFTQTMNPLKMYEYLAAGKPIVSTAVAGADQFQDLIKLAVSPEDFAEKVEKELHEDTEEKRQRRVHMAQSHGWGSRIRIMVEAIEAAERERE